MPTLRQAAEACQGCGLYQRATQTVFGEGPEGAEVMLVGEQPGDREDLEGQPFVGPAGRVLDAALTAAGIDRSRVYVTNAVKHFKWQPRGKRRIHMKPSAGEISACRPWLQSELEAVRPRLIVCLGATSAQSVLGSDFRVSRQHGQLLASAWGIPVLPTIHPSAVLRAPDDSSREAMRDQLVKDLSVAAACLRSRRA